MVVLCSLLVAVSLSQTPSAADPGGRISGRVTLEGANTPVAGARIMLMPAMPAGRPAGRPAGPMGPPPQTLTDQEGRFAFERLTPGTYRIDAQKTGYAPLLDLSRARTVEVGAGQAIDGVDLQLQRGAVIAGKLLDPAGDPLPEARVMALRRVSPPGAPPRLMPAFGPGQPTNDLGEFRVSGLPPGEYFVAAMPRSMPMMPMLEPPPRAAPYRPRGRRARRSRRPSIQAPPIRPRRNRSPSPLALKSTASSSACSPPRPFACLASLWTRTATRSPAQW